MNNVSLYQKQYLQLASYVAYVLLHRCYRLREVTYFIDAVDLRRSGLNPPFGSTRLQAVFNRLSVDEAQRALTPTIGRGRGRSEIDAAY